MPQAARFEYKGATLRAEPLTDALGPIRLVWLHGWGQSRESLRAIAESLVPTGESWILDLPGHGEAPNPALTFSPAHYAHLVAMWLATQPAYPTVIIGHSLGFRVSIHMAAAQTPTLVGLVALGGAGVPRPLSPKQLARRKTIRWLMKAAHVIKPYLGEAPLNRLRQKFGSADYQNVAPAMRATFIATVNDDVTTLCPTITLPALLIYGDADTETPPAVGEKFHHLLSQSQLQVLPYQTHYSLVSGGRHVVAPLIQKFVQGITN